MRLFTSNVRKPPREISQSGTEGLCQLGELGVFGETGYTRHCWVDLLMIGSVCDSGRMCWVILMLGIAVHI